MLNTMKPWLLIFVGFLILTRSGFAAGPRDAQWREVTAALQQGLPKTALERLQPILDAALAEQAWAEAAKAIAQRITLEAQIEGNRPEERVQRYRQALANNPPAPVRPVLHALLAHAYWAYFDQNRWRIQQRTAGAGAPSDDLLTWDLPRVFAAIDASFNTALENPGILRSTPIESFSALLEPGTVPDRYRPTLYDFLVHEALQFYGAGEQAGARPADAFVIPADSPALAPLPEFLAWTPSTTDTQAVAFKAVRRLQELLQSHAQDPDRSALLDADLARLQFVGNVAVGADKDARLARAFLDLAERARDHELSARARHAAAQVLLRLGQRAEAHRVASEGVRTFPDSPGGKLCRQVVQTLEAPQSRIHVERIWNAPWPVLEVHHTHARAIHFRVVAANWDAHLDRRRSRPEQLRPEERVALLRETPVHTWSAPLPPTPDFKEHLTEVPAPETLRPGFYFLLASRRADFAEDDNEVTYTPFWVSDLALVVRSRAGDWEGWVLDAAAGTPLAGARVNAWYLDERGNRIALDPATTDASGAFRFSGAAGTHNRGHLFKASLDTRVVATGDDLWVYPSPPPPTREERTLFFTDRSLYRPGQLIHYKGICHAVAPGDRTYETLAGRAVTVAFLDANGQEVARASHQANDYGSFSGTFTAPRASATGALTLNVVSGPPGSQSVQVEEYKRPKFETTLDPAPEGSRLDAEVIITGRATTYAGTPVNDAEVRWTARRQVHFPPWWGWFRSPGPSHDGAQEIAQGTSRTRADGSFAIAFKALPDPAVAAQPEATFGFEIHADVTDAAGETRSADRTTRLGQAALELTGSVPEWALARQPIKVAIETRTLDELPVGAQGSFKVYRLRAPDRIQRARLDDSIRMVPGSPDAPTDPGDPNQWPLGEVVAEASFATGTNGSASQVLGLPAGQYRILLEAKDGGGKTVQAKVPLQVRDPEAATSSLGVPFDLAAESWRVEPGETFTALWSTGYPTGQAFVEVEHRNRLIQRFWTPANRTQHLFRLPITEAMRGGITLHVTYVRENRLYRDTRTLEVPWSNQEFELTWETFRSRLEPGQKETWTALVKPRRPDAAAATQGQIAAEMVATLYDASLDQFLPTSWPSQFDGFARDFSSAIVHFANSGRWLDRVQGRSRTRTESVTLTYRTFPSAFVQRRGRPQMMFRTMARSAAAPEAEAMPAAAADSFAFTVADGAARGGLAMAKGVDAAGTLAGAGGAGAPPPIPPASEPALRRNLQETAFFFPHLTTSKDGGVRMEFTLPEALTRWRFLGFAHDTRLRAGRLEGFTTTTRDLMVLPNPPRFLREGDEVEFSARVINRSDAPSRGRVSLHLTFATGNENDADASADSALGNATPELAFDLPPRETRAFTWRLKVPDGCGFLAYRVVARGERHSDGEAGFLPVLSRRVLVTESIPLPIRGPSERVFTFAALRDSARSATLTHESFTVQMASNPAWYAVLALPYLMEYPHECSEQLFNRVYANALAQHLASRDPRIRTVFEQWRATPALDSPLEKNDDLKAIALAETPWVRQAKSESQARRNIGLLFDPERTRENTTRALAKLTERTLPEGGWAWFPGGPFDEYITLYLVAGFGRLRELGVDLPLELALQALRPLDLAMEERWRRLRDEKQLDGSHLTPHIAFYLYARSFFLARQPLEPAHLEAFRYWVKQAEDHWLSLDHRLPQGHVALALHRLRAADSGFALQTQVPEKIVRSLAERSVKSEELGMSWREDEASASWFRAPIETQALMIELFHSVARDPAAVEELKVWLLKQKQTQDWKTTKATADAVYALLLQGTDLLADRRLVDVSVAGRSLTPGAPGALSQPRNGPAPSQPEAGTGFFETRFQRGEVTAAMANIRVNKPTPGVAWGSAHWQYFEDVSNVRAHTSSPLKMEKALFTKIATANGPELRPLRGAAKVGDEVVVRLTLRTDRDLEYVHLKDQRGSGTEPVNVLSGYRFQDGLGYFESTRDAASHFFISYLAKGTYVFEYPVRIQLRGNYTAGIAEVQCLYAPEFNSHSEALALQVE